MQELVKYTTINRRGYITLNRPDKRNALNDAMIAALSNAFSLAFDDSQVKVVILQAEGEAFCAGADLAYMEQLERNGYEENLQDSQNLMNLFRSIYYGPKPVIAAVQGHAIAGGTGLATVCDFCIAIDEAKFGYTEVKLGFVPALVMVFLARKLGEGRARELTLTGRLIDAKEAASLGLINKSLSASDFQNEVEALAAQLIENNSAQSMSTIKTMLAKVQEMPLDDALQYAAEQNAHTRATPDFKKGIRSFLEKRKPEW